MRSTPAHVAHVAHIVLAAALVLLAAAPAAHALGPIHMSPGKWETTMTMEMAGMPAGMMHPITSTQCVKPGDVKDPDSVAKRASRDRAGKEQDCKFTFGTTGADHLTWSFECANGSSGDADFTYAGDSYEGTIHIKAQDAQSGGSHELTQKVKAHRLGDC